MYSSEENLTIALLGGGAVLLLFMLFFLISILRHQRQKAKLHIGRLNSDILLLEKERARIAYDFHDAIGPTLSACRIKLELLKVDAADAQLVQEMTGHIDGLMQQVRNVSNQLIPRTLEKQGLAVALHELAMETGRLTTAQIHFTDDTIYKIAQDPAIHLYRIVQEILNNMLKHAGASKVDIRLSNTSKELSLSVTDNGKGFDRSLIQKRSSGLGLQNILSRADLIGATVYLTTEPDKGTDFLIQMPIKRDESIHE